MVPVIYKNETGRQIRKYMNLRGLSVQDVKTSLCLGCVQSVYHWLDGQSLPSLDNLYALSELLRVPMDRLVVGSNSLHRIVAEKSGSNHLARYQQLFIDRMAA